VSDSFPFSIESIGTATISVRGPKGPVELVLHDVALVPGFFTNIVSISKLSSQGIHMDSGEALLYTNHQGQRRNFAYCPKENGHWILSTRNPMQPSIFSHSTTNEEITQSSRRIHEAMGHLGQMHSLYFTQLQLVATSKAVVPLQLSVRHVHLLKRNS
jgi:hypothetical protein